MKPFKTRGEHLSGAQKRKLKKQRIESESKLIKIDSFFNPPSTSTDRHSDSAAVTQHSDSDLVSASAQHSDDDLISSRPSSSNINEGNTSNETASDFNSCTSSKSAVPSLSSHSATDDHTTQVEIDPEENKNGEQSGSKKGKKGSLDSWVESKGRTKRSRNEEDKEPASKKSKTPSKVEESCADFDFNSCEKTTPDGKTWNFKISSWNVAGLRAWVKKGGVHYIEKELPDILTLQETKCAEKKLPSEVEVEGYHRYWLGSEKEGYAGVALYTKEKPLEVKYGIGDKELDKDGRLIIAEYEKFFLVCTYVVNAGQGLKTLDKKLHWNELFLKLMKELDAKKPVILTGDLNVAHLDIDIKNPKTNQKSAGFTKEEREGMTQLLSSGFVDTFRHLYPDKEGAYTFWPFFNNCRARNTGWRLDYFVVSERLVPAVCDSVIREKVLGSDHCPVTLFLHI